MAYKESKCGSSKRYCHSKVVKRESLIYSTYNIHSMATKSFNITYKGAQAPVEYEDDMPFGKFEEIIRKCSNFREGTNPVDNVQVYRKEILLGTITKAPFEISEEGLNSLGYKVVTIIADKILTAYPLGSYLNQMMKPFEESMKRTN